MSMIQTPIGKELRIFVNKESVVDVPLIIETDITFPLSSQFEAIMGGGDSKLLTIFGSLSKELFGKGFSGQFKQLGARIWSKTEPLNMSLTVGFYIDKRNPDAYSQVYEPTIKLAHLTLPTDDGVGGSLVAPGPTLISAIKGEKKGEGGKFISIEIGKILRIDSAIVTKAEPTFSNEVDSYGYPIWSKINLEFGSIVSATTSMLPLKGRGTSHGIGGNNA